ncbi:MAG TPA: c-type cytochrome [Paucimonas sp.]|nr:c-type cytochrome [Paucimonas sp.]
MRMVLMALCASIALSSCSTARREPGADDIARAQALRPQDAQLAERYERSCMACHAVQGSGAPLTGFVPQWEERLGKGMDRLVEHAYEGFNAMPVRGLCNDCTKDDMRALIRFMSAGAAA